MDLMKYMKSIADEHYHEEHGGDEHYHEDDGGYAYQSAAVMIEVSSSNSQDSVEQIILIDDQYSTEILDRLNLWMMNLEHLISLPLMIIQEGWL